MSIELCKKYRPKSFKQVIGQDVVISTLISLGKRKVIPHAILLTGPSGVGKTTIARILRKKLSCSEHDYKEMDIGTARGIDDVRQLKKNMYLAPMGGKCRVYCLDEIHRATVDFFNGALKMLEDTPDHVYFILCTTDPQKLPKTIINRCTELRLSLLNRNEIESLIKEVVRKEEVVLSEDVVDRIASVVEGSPRKALVLLHLVLGMEAKEEQLAAIEAGDSSRDAIEICRALQRSTVSWGEVAKILKGIDDLQDKAEGIRWLILSYFTTVALGGNLEKAERACAIIERFEENFYDSKRAGLVAACFAVV